jgi:sec-independent protein translocase protein TatA
MGSDLGGAVKGFKDGMKDASGNPTTEEKPAGQVAASTTAEKTTIDVEAKTKS